MISLIESKLTILYRCFHLLQNILRSTVQENYLVLLTIEWIDMFIKRYKDMSSRGKFADAALASSPHWFGWVFGGRTKNTQGGFLRRGRRIPVNAKAAGRRRGTLSRGKAKVTHERHKRACYHGTNTMTTRKPAKGKRLHSLSENTTLGIQNAGKW